MSYVQIESSVARHRKFVKAGPAPSWLWFCGVAYCQEGLTDGFIAVESIDYLGVKNAKQLATRLVDAGLWDTVPGGWMVHDYLQHNKSAEQVRALKARRGAGGALGGRPKVNHNGNHQGSRTETLKVNLPENPSTSTSTSTSTASATTTTTAPKVPHDPPDRERVLPPYGDWLGLLQANYPEKARSGGYRTENSFFEVFRRRSDVTPSAVFEQMLVNLETQKAGEQWASGRVPNLARWLSEDLWTQVHEPARRSRLTNDAPPAREWECPHVESCGAPAQCHTLSELDPRGIRYPRKPSEGAHA